MMKEINLHFSMAYNDLDFAEVTSNFSRGKYPGVERMVTARIGLEDLREKGFEELVKHKEKHGKILISPNMKGASG